jgi:hypothetical protein
MKYKARKITGKQRKRETEVEINLNYTRSAVFYDGPQVRLRDESTEYVLSPRSVNDMVNHLANRDKMLYLARNAIRAMILGEGEAAAVAYAYIECARIVTDGSRATDGLIRDREVFSEIQMTVKAEVEREAALSRGIASAMRDLQSR